MPLDKEKLDALLEEIKHLKDKPVKKQKAITHPTGLAIKVSSSPLKKDFLLTTEKQAYFDIDHYYKLVMLSIDDAATAFEIWIKGILPLLLVRHGLDREEWERICDLGDSLSQVQEELIEDWKKFFQKITQHGLIDKEILALINEGRLRVEKMRKER